MARKTIHMCCGCRLDGGDDHYRLHFTILLAAPEWVIIIWLSISRVLLCGIYLGVSLCGRVYVPIRGRSKFAQFVRWSQLKTLNWRIAGWMDGYWSGCTRSGLGVLSRSSVCVWPSSLSSSSSPTTTTAPTS